MVSPLFIILYFQGMFMFVSNQVDFGHQTNSDNYDVSHLHEELYQIFDNELVSSKFISVVDLKGVPQEPGIPQIRGHW